MTKVQDPLVSIIMPVFNEEKYIKETVLSVINQTYENWELIMVDDCSTDQTVDTIKSLKEEYENLKLKLFELPQNSGAAVARNKAIFEAEGKYIAFLDSDDLWLNNKLEKQIKFMEKNKLVFSYTNYELIDENGNKKNKHIEAPNFMTYNMLLKNTAIGCLTVIINIDEVGKLKMPNIRAGQDTAYWLRILKKGYIAYNLNKNLAMYRIGNGSISSNKLNALKRTWHIYRRVEKINFIPSIYYFSFYLFNALKRRI